MGNQQLKTSVRN